MKACWGTGELSGDSRDVTRSHGTSLWKKISMVKQRFQDCIKWKLGKGDRIHFWKDESVGRGRLEDHFPRIFVIASPKNMRIAAAFTEGSGRRGQNVNVTKNLNDWEIEEYEAVLFLLIQIPLNGNMDQLVWNWKEKREIHCQIIQVSDQEGRYGDNTFFS